MHRRNEQTSDVMDTFFGSLRREIPENTEEAVPPATSPPSPPCPEESKDSCREEVRETTGEIPGPGDVSSGSASLPPSPSVPDPIQEEELPDLPEEGCAPSEEDKKSSGRSAGLSPKKSGGRKKGISSKEEQAGTGESVSLRKRTFRIPEPLDLALGRMAVETGKSRESILAAALQAYIPSQFRKD